MENSATVNKVIGRFKNDKLISGNISKFSRTLCLYIQPKIHKEGAPVRPVISYLKGL